MRDEAKAKVVRRLRRIEGQVRGVARMVDTGRPPVDAVIQLRAVRAALRGAEQEMLRGFLTETIDEIGAVAGAPALVQRIQELIDGLGSDATSVPREDFSRDAPIGDSQP